MQEMLIFMIIPNRCPIEVKSNLNYLKWQELQQFFPIIDCSYDQKLVVFRSVQMYSYHIAIRPDFATLSWHFGEVMGTSLFLLKKI